LATKKTPAAPAPAALVVPKKAQLVLPDNIRAKFATEVAQIQSRIAAPSGNRIKPTAKKTFRMPDGTENAGPLEAIIVDFVILNAFYEGAYDPDDILPPVCFAFGTDRGTISPHDKLPGEPVCESCAACPNNQFGSSGKGKACNNGYLLALLTPDADATTNFMTIKVSPTGLKHFDAYLRSIMQAVGAPPRAVVTEISLDPESEYASLRFGNPRPNDIIDITEDRLAEAQQMLSTPPDNWLAPPVEKAKPAKKAASRGR